LQRPARAHKAAQFNCLHDSATSVYAPSTRRKSPAKSPQQQSGFNKHGWSARFIIAHGAKFSISIAQMCQALANACALPALPAGILFNFFTSK